MWDGEIMRRLLRDVATGRAVGNPSTALSASVTTLAGPGVIEHVMPRYTEETD